MRVKDADLQPGQIARILLHFRNDFILDNGIGHRPGWIEIDRLNTGGNLRAWMFDIADNGDKTLLHLAVGDGLNRGRGNIDDDITVAKTKIHTRQPLRRGGELAEARRRRHVHRGQCRALRQARLAQAIARLERLDGGGQPVVIRRILGLSGGKIALNRQPLAQRQHILALAATPHASGHMWPAAGVHDRGIALGGFGRGEESFRQQRRRRVDRERGFPRNRRRGALFGDDPARLWRFSGRSGRSRVSRSGRGRVGGGRAWCLTSRGSANWRRG